MITQPIDLTVMPDNNGQYMDCWPDGRELSEHVPEIWIDMIPFLAARVLISQGYDAERPFIVHLRGADYTLCKSTLGQVAATPVVNAGKPVTHGTLCIWSHGAPWPPKRDAGLKRWRAKRGLQDDDDGAGKS
jgi:hypothetical protein